MSDFYRYWWKRDAEQQQMMPQGAMPQQRVARSPDEEAAEGPAAEPAAAPALLLIDLWDVFCER